MSEFRAIPVGTIVAYAADNLDDFLPKNWTLCDGTSFSRTDPKYKSLFDAIGTSNGSDSGDSFKIPDLRGMFLRGDNVTSSLFNDKNAKGSLKPGNRLSYRTGNGVDNESKQFKVRVKNQADQGTQRVVKGGTYAMDVGFPDVSFDFTTDKETRCVNMYMYWVIKITDSATGGTQDIPIGGILPYAGNGSNVKFPSLLECDGGNVLGTDVPELAEIFNKKLAHKYAKTPDNSKVFLPDLRGAFVRGECKDSAQDPDWKDRYNAPNGSKGAGTWQISSSSFGTSSFKLKNLNNNPGAISPCLRLDHGGGHDGLTNGSKSGYNELVGGGSESRPCNVSVPYYLNAFGPRTATAQAGSVANGTAKTQDIPIGTIIAIPGTPASSYLRHTQWLPCDGNSTRLKDFYPKLWEVLGDTWGKSDEQQFTVPNFSGQFIRGESKDGSSRSDPDWSTRTDANGVKTKVGRGSYQRWSTGTPTNFNIKNWDSNSEYFTGVVNFGRGSGSVDNTVYQYNFGASDNDITTTWDIETAPASVVVSFWIRAT